MAATGQLLSFPRQGVVSCAKEVEALPRIFGHAVDLRRKVEVPAAVTCADGHG
jgi:hypothetical protein